MNSISGIGRVLLGLSLAAQVYAVDWSENAKMPVEGNRKNIYNLDQSQWQETIQNGKIHTQIYPISPTYLIPYRPFKFILENEQSNKIKKIIYNQLKEKTGLNSIDSVYDYLGLNPYPLESDHGVYSIPYPDKLRPDYPLGVTFKNVNNTKALTFSCAICHSSNLFGKTVLGLQNRFPRGNDFYVLTKSILPFVTPKIFKNETHASQVEVELFQKMKKDIRFIGAKKPLHKGLDSALAQVALSLAKRGNDPYAKKYLWKSIFPSKTLLTEHRADSKPMPWWTLKYKTKWLSDGSVISGNPIMTNILWNEIGRGADLKKLESWVKSNSQIIKELTAAVFSIEPPLYTDFFPVGSVDLKSARRGEKLFVQSCQKCHGKYIKKWSSPDSKKLSKSELLKTTKLIYPRRTKIIDVGTDPSRHLATNALVTPLNRLKFSKTFGIKIKQQKGYVPPPLIGIWARWPYFHNNSVPNLCALLMPWQNRPKSFFTGEANNKNSDFDQDCVGYPTGEKVPHIWKEQKDSLFDTSKPALSNRGHDKMYFREGKYIFSNQDVRDIINFLKVL